MPHRCIRISTPTTVGTGNQGQGRQAINLLLALLVGYAAGVASYALIAAWILRPRPRRATK